MNIDQIIEQLKQEKNRIDGALKALGEVGTPSNTNGRKGPRTMSPAARKRISEAQKARWKAAKAKAGK